MPIGIIFPILENGVKVPREYAIVDVRLRAKQSFSIWLIFESEWLNLAIIVVC